MSWVGFYNGKPQEIVHIQPEGETSENFEWLEVSNDLVPYVNSEYVAENGKVIPPSKEYFISQLKADLASIRWNAQNYFVEYDGKQVRTDDATLAALTSKIMDVQLSDKKAKEFSWNFKGLSEFFTINYDDAVKIRELISGHQQKCFDRASEIEKVLDGQGKKAKILDILAVFLEEVSKGWPLPDKAEGTY